MISNISVPFGVIQFQKHKTVKSRILEDIDNSLYPPVISYDHKISKSDWDTECNLNKGYADYFLQEVGPELLNFAKSISFTKYIVHNLWFQQYKNGDSHSWHTHDGCQYTCIYYLELNQCNPPTQFINPIDDLSIFQVEVHEGDILIIPSMIKHQSPIITSSTRKTIISFNLSFMHNNNAGDY